MLVASAATNALLVHQISVTLQLSSRVFLYPEREDNCMFHLCVVISSFLNAIRCKCINVSSLVVVLFYSIQVITHSESFSSNILSVLVNPDI